MPGHVQPLLTTRNLGKRFGGLVAVDHVDFSLAEGEIRALIGPNGAGKTTLVGMLCGRIDATTGDIAFEGSNISTLPAHKRVRLGIAYTFQITSIFAGLPVLENVALAIRRTDTNDTEGQALTALARVHLQDQADKLAGDLAYGHQRLLEIAMGLALRPKLLILDEPTQGLAQPEIEAFIDLLRQLRETTTLLLIEHNMDVVMSVADQITVLHQGAILAEGTPDAVRRNNAVRSAYLGHN